MAEANKTEEKPLKLVGKSIPKIDAIGKVTGRTLYPGDFNLPEQLIMKTLFAGRPHAIVKAIDVSEAEKIPGVVLILTAKDVPVNEYGLGVKDQPVLCGPGSSKEYCDRVRFVGDHIALVIAETESAAAEAVQKIHVEYEDLPVVSDPEIAIDDSSYRIHPERESNIFTQYRIRKGNVTKAFAEADVIIEAVYHTPVQEHVYLQPEAGIAYFDEEGRITIVVAGQWTHKDREQVAHALGLSEDRIRIIYPAIGGAFGGREDMSVQIIIGLAILRLKELGIKRPVKTIWSREESIVGHHKRHPYIIRCKWAAKKDGTIIAAKNELLADGGAYIYTSPKVLGNATLMSVGPYEIENVEVDSTAVYTNNIPNGAFRGFGGPQAAFAAECQVNKIAESLNIDPVQIRLKNTLKEGSILAVGTPIPRGVTIDKVVAQCATKGNWNDKRYRQPSQQTETRLSDKKKGVGFACAYKNVGFSFGAPEQCQAKIELHGESAVERAVVYHAGADVGQGVHTVIAQMAADALDLPLDKLNLVFSDTGYTPESGSASASRLTFMAGNSIRGAAAEALEKWDAGERPAIAEYQYRPPKTTPYDKETGKSEPNFSYGYVSEMVELEVDTETGEIEILNIRCTNDVGQSINPALVKGQIEGGLVQATGYTLMENFISRNAIPLTSQMKTYLIPTIMDIPHKIDIDILEYPDPIGPWGARGMGEMMYLPLAPAIIAALHDATGVWFDRFPLTAENVLRGLGGLD